MQNESALPPPQRRVPRWLPVAGMAALLLVVSVALLWRARPRLSDETARAVVFSTLQRETRQSFLVTGALDITVTTRVRNTRRLLPGILDVNLGSVESTVRAPGRVSYGFPLTDLRSQMIQVIGDTIEVRVPTPRVYSIEPRLSQMEVETDAGWLRLRDETQHEVQQRATALVQSALRTQAEHHLRDSSQPRLNTATTLHDMLRPAFVAAGVRDPIFRFIIDDQLIYRRGRD